MKIKVQISRKLLIRMAMFIAVIGAATLLDVYFENNPEKLKEMQSDTADHSGEANQIFFVNHVVTISAKSSVQKQVIRKLQVKSHDKLIQKYHLLRNYQVLKAEVQTQTTPLINSYQHLAFKKYFFSAPDDDPLIS